MAAGLHISISAEPVFDIAGFTVTNSNISSVLVSIALILFALTVRSKLQTTGKPTGIQNFAELLIETIYNFIQSITGDHKRTRVFFPLVASFMLFILLNNWSGLLPGVGTIGVIHHDDSHKEEKMDDHAGLQFLQAQAAETESDSEAEAAAYPAEEAHADEYSEKADHYGPTIVPIFRPGTADINGTLALALISVIATQIIGVQFQGLSYFKKFINFSNPINFFVGLLETISEFAKIISFAFRLFGNIFAGEVLLVVISFLTFVVIPMPVYGLEIFVGFIQALVFSMLTLVFFNMATHAH